MTELKNREQSKQHKIDVATQQAKEAAEKLEGKTIKLTAKAGKMVSCLVLLHQKKSQKKLSHSLQLILIRERYQLRILKISEHIQLR